MRAEEKAEEEWSDAKEGSEESDEEEEEESEEEGGEEEAAQPLSTQTPAAIQAESRGGTKQQRGNRMVAKEVCEQRPGSDGGASPTAANQFISCSRKHPLSGDHELVHASDATHIEKKMVSAVRSRG